MAGTAVTNNENEWINDRKIGIYDGVAVKVIRTNGEISTVCPDLDQDLYVKGVKILD